jgi:hypothetical protein
VPVEIEGKSSHWYFWMPSKKEFQGDNDVCGVSNVADRSG